MRKARKAKLEPKATKAREVIPVQLEPMVKMEPKATKAREVILVQLEPMVKMEPKAIKVTLGLKGIKATRVIQAQLAYKVTWA